MRDLRTTIVVKNFFRLLSVCNFLCYGGALSNIKQKLSIYERFHFDICFFFSIDEAAISEVYAIVLIITNWCSAGICRCMYFVARFMLACLVGVFLCWNASSGFVPFSVYSFSTYLNIDCIWS